VVALMLGAYFQGPLGTREVRDKQLTYAP